MIRKTDKIILLIIVVVATIFSSDRVADGYGTPGDYLYEFSPDAREFGRGGGSGALSDNSSSIYLNPAGLGNIETVDMVAAFMRLGEDFNYYYASFAYPFGKFGTVGLGLSGIGISGIPRIDTFSVQNGTYGAMDNAFMIAYGKEFIDRISIGLNIKIATQKIDNYSDVGVGLDLGAKIKALDWLYFGVGMIHLGGPKITLVSETENYSNGGKLGVGLKLFSDKLQINGDALALDLFSAGSSFQDVVHRGIRWSAGVEYQIIEYLAARVGINDRNFSFGTSFSVANFDIDYAAIVNLESKDFRSPISNAFSVRYSFGKSIPAKEKLLNEKISKSEYSEKIIEIQKLYIKGYTQKAYDIADSLHKLMPENSDIIDIYNDVKTRLATEKCGEYYMAATKAFDEGDYEEANIQLAKLFELTPNDSTALILEEKLILRKDNSGRSEKIKNLYAQKKYDKMLKEISVILNIDSTNIIALEYKNKVSDYVNKKEADKYYALASKFYYEDKNIEEANSNLQEALKLMPNHKEAKALYEKLSKEIKEMYLKKVGNIVNSNELDVDNDALKKLIELDVQDRLIEVQKLFQNRRYREASDLVISILKDDPENISAKNLSVEIDKEKSHAESERLYSEALKMYNENRLTAAEEKVQNAVDLYPQNIVATELLDRINLTIKTKNLTDAKTLISNNKTEDLNTAIKIIKDYLALDKGNDEAIKMLADAESKILIIEANAYIDKGEYEKANRAIEKALSINPNNKDVQGAFKNIKEVIELFIN